jgi:hypothetical protein
MIGFIRTLLQVLLITLKYGAINDLDTFQFTAAHILEFPIFTSHLAMGLTTETSTSNHYEVFLLSNLQSLWNFRTKNSSGRTPLAYD